MQTVKLQPTCGYLQQKSTTLQPNLIVQLTVDVHTSFSSAIISDIDAAPNFNFTCRVNSENLAEMSSCS